MKNKDNILFVNGCVRRESRTLELARYFVGKCTGSIKELNLAEENLTPIDGALLAKRDELIVKGDFSHDMFCLARDFAAADTVIIAAPYWDLSFPSLVKIYLEWVSVCGIAFRYDNGLPIGLCRAKQLVYITTAGGKIYQNLGFDYVKALAEGLYGIKSVVQFGAEELDIYGADVDGIMSNAKKDIDNYFKGE